MINQTCAICEKNDFVIVFKQNFNINKIDEKIFSARRLPDKLHYQIVRCKNCGLIYSNPVLPYKDIEKLYKKSTTTYNQQIENLNKTYGFYLRRLEKYHVNKGRLLDIGCGNGFFLKEAWQQGYQEVWGVEPGKKSVAKAPSAIKKNIIIDIFKPGLFKKNYFDVICCFQTLDHIPNPNAFLKECFIILKKNGLVLFFNHDADSLSAKILGEKSPIIDIEHTYLYNKNTMEKIFIKHSFDVVMINSAFNIHSLAYWIRLLPVYNPLKLWLIKIINAVKLDSLKLKIHGGNLYLIGKKQ